jgi:hypothetical protein
LRRIGEITRGAGSIELSWTRKLEAALKAGDTKGIRHAEQKVFASMLRYDRCEQLLAASKKHSPTTEAEVSKRAAELYKKACRKLGRKKADKENHPAVFDPQTLTQRIAWELTCGWLRNRNGAPGYCFFGDSDAIRRADRVGCQTASNGGKREE